MPEASSEVQRRERGMETDTLKHLFGLLEPCSKKDGTAHRHAQERLCQVGKELGYQVIAEYRVFGLIEAYRKSYIDVVWIADCQLAAAFEIHVRLRERCLFQATGRKDMEKLRKLGAARKFIVNVSPKTGEAFFHRI
jgi:hypothetical protein